MLLPLIPVFFSPKGSEAVLRRCAFSMQTGSCCMQEIVGSLIQGGNKTDTKISHYCTNTLLLPYAVYEQRLRVLFYTHLTHFISILSFSLCQNLCPYHSVKFQLTFPLSSLPVHSLHLIHAFIPAFTVILTAFNSPPSNHIDETT